ncbi:hypothetical protein [Fibrisoma limi]|nr:hypothetical protein [Fibrisoma limi]
MKFFIPSAIRLLVFTVFIYLTACSPDQGTYEEEPAPDYTGTYQIVSVSSESPAAPAPAPSGTVAVVKIWGYTSIVSVTLTLNKEELLAGELTLRKASGATYDMYIGNSIRYGTIDGKEVTLNYFRNNVKYTVVARK